MLQVRVKEAEAAFDMTDGFEMTLSRETIFQNMELSKDMYEAIFSLIPRSPGRAP